MNYVTFNQRGWSPLSDFRREMDKLFDDFWHMPTSTGTPQEMTSQWSPACDVEETDSQYLISLEMAGVPREQLSVEFQDNQLTVSGERRSDSTKGDNTQRYTERRYGKFQRSFTMPAAIDAGKVEAHYQDGILRIIVPKAEAAKPRQIKITSGAGSGLLGRLLGTTKKEQDGAALPASESKPERVA